MTQNKLEQLLEQVGKDVHYARLFTPFYKEMIENPDCFKISKIGKRSEIIELGKHDIPKKGKYLRFIDNDWYDSQSQEFKSNYPEINTKGIAALVEQVDAVNFNKKAGEIELTITRYLIKQKSLIKV